MRNVTQQPNKFKAVMRLRLATALENVFERGLEIALAGNMIIDGRSVFAMRQNGEPLAPFLSSALKFLSPNPQIEAFFLIMVGCLHLIILGFSVRSDKYTGRALMSALALFTYVAVAFAVVTGLEPNQAAERFAWSAVMAFVCVVYLGSRAVAKACKKGGDIE